MYTPTCDCLTQYNADLPHYSGCGLDVATKQADHRDIRCLAELAAWRDLDTALYVLKNHTVATRPRKSSVAL